jgi:hypothetical protein
VPGIRKTSPRSVNKSGAIAGAVLCGCGHKNGGLRLRVLQDQRLGDGGPIEGRFVILDVGDNMHAQSLQPLLQRVTNAGEVLGIIRQEHPGCVSVANTNILVLE